MNDRFKFRLPAINTKNGYVKMRYFDFSTAGIAHMVFPPYWDVKPIEQSIGLKDRNGHLIYENDIVNICDIYMGVVDWDKSQYQIIRCQPGLPIRLKYVPIRNIDTQIAVEVVGNIHENVELLEGK